MLNAVQPSEACLSDCTKMSVYSVYYFNKNAFLSENPELKWPLKDGIWCQIRAAAQRRFPKVPQQLNVLLRISSLFLDNIQIAVSIMSSCLKR